MAHRDDDGRNRSAMEDEVAASEAAPIQVCRALVRRVEPRLSELVDVMVEKIREEVPGYGSASNEALAAVRRGVALSAELSLRTLGDRRGLGARERAVLERLGEERARQGVPLDELEAAVRIANAEGFDFLHAEMCVLAAGWRSRRVDLWACSRELSLHAQEFRATQWSAFERGYRRVGGLDVAEDNGPFLLSLLAGEFDNDDDIEVESQRCGSELEAPCALVVVTTADEDTAQLCQPVAELVPELPAGLTSRVLADPYPHVVLVVPLRGKAWCELMATLERRLADVGLVAIVEPIAALVNVAPVYRGLRDRLTALGRLRLPARVLRAFDLTLEWAATLLDREARFLDVDTVLGPVLARRQDRARRDMETLTALRDGGGSPTAVARRLGVSVKEVHRKLRGIERRTALDLSNPVDVARLGWALSLYWADPGVLPEPGEQAWGRTARADAAVGAERRP